MTSIIQRIRSNHVIDQYVSEDELLDELRFNPISIDDVMTIINSDMELSNEFIIAFIDFIDWTILTRPLPECIIMRFIWKIIHWDAQLYGRLRTIDFLIQHKNKFDWRKLSSKPPQWFTEYHAELFCNDLDWFLLTPFISGYSMNTLCLHANDIDWEWMSVNNIPNEEFARRFINHIKWDHHNLDVSNISTEFLYEFNCAREIEYNLKNKLHTKPRVNSFSLIISPIVLEDFDPNAKLRIGGSITLMFFRKHFTDIDIDEIKKRNLLTTEMQDVIHNIDDI